MTDDDPWTPELDEAHDRYLHPHDDYGDDEETPQ